MCVIRSKSRPTTTTTTTTVTILLLRRLSRTHDGVETVPQVPATFASYGRPSCRPAKRFHFRVDGGSEQAPNEAAVSSLSHLYTASRRYAFAKTFPTPQSAASMLKRHVLQTYIHIHMDQWCWCWDSISAAGVVVVVAVAAHSFAVLFMREN